MSFRHFMELAQASDRAPSQALGRRGSESTDVDGGSVCESDDKGNLPHALGRMFIFCRTSSIGISIHAQ